MLNHCNFTVIHHIQTQICECVLALIAEFVLVQAPAKEVREAVGRLPIGALGRRGGFGRQSASNWYSASTVQFKKSTAIFITI